MSVSRIPSSDRLDLTQAGWEFRLPKFKPTLESRSSPDSGSDPELIESPSDLPLSMIKLSGRAQVSAYKRAELIKGRLLASLLARLPATEAEHAQSFIHQDQTLTLSLAGAGWSLEIELGLTQVSDTSEVSRVSDTQVSQVSDTQVSQVSDISSPSRFEPTGLTLMSASGAEIVFQALDSNPDHAVIIWSGEALKEPISHTTSGASVSLLRRWRVAHALVTRALKSGIARSTAGANIDPSAYLHPTVEVSGPVRVGASTKIWHFSKLLGPLTIGEHCSFGQNVVIERGVTIGDNVKVQNNVSIYAGVILEDDVFCGPSMVFTNVGTPRSHYPRRDEYSVTRVGRGASIGANSTIVCGHNLGRYCFVGAGAVVTRDVPDFALVYGNPARVRGWACYCGIKLSFSDVGSSVLPTAPTSDSPKFTRELIETAEEHSACVECGRRYHKRGERVQLLE